MENTKIIPIDDHEKLKSAFTQTEEIILKRRSVRMYKKKQVPEFMVKRILEAGRFAPSAGNGQPWKFVVVRDPDVIQGITNTTIKICKLFKVLIDYRQPGRRWLKPLANLFIRMKPADLHPTPFGAVTMIADGNLSLYHNAPTVIIIFKDVRGIANPDLDAGIAGQNMVLAAHSMELGTCWVGFAKLAFQYTNKWKKFFNIGYPYKFITSLSIGWPVGNPDGFVQRQIHPVDWYENKTKRVVE
jgi:nitroreductase